MGKRSRRRVAPQLPAPAASHTTPPPAVEEIDPERSLLHAIANGELDEHLSALADAVHARHHLLHTVKAATALAALCVGDEVRINHTVTPKYLHGVRGRVIDLDEDTATVCLDRPVGRFKSGHLRCPPLALDRLEPQAVAS
ncbi:MAG: hypothetical protein LC790_20520 [Actinobacteria bacterium]|nr:hypothetical protein [Actinomycetota bacterium]